MFHIGTCPICKSTFETTDESSVKSYREVKPECCAPIVWEA